MTPQRRGKRLVDLLGTASVPERAWPFLDEPLPDGDQASSDDDSENHDILDQEQPPTLTRVD